MNYKKEAKKIWQEYKEKYPILSELKSSVEVEGLVEYVLMQGYDKGLDFCLKAQKPIKSLTPSGTKGGGEK